ncbi:hypothetical protein B0H66DRAFT_644063 [Apodospora peruviana]|uniref:LysM domain-containing protein n=1 Tax=Apodospora peruviana TaxID=516989 RepID=A0AAE0HU45_9PEZI|nr:hypothetical protein B0H66DRAFT_644063 [Apodospora peruviana]
MSLKMSLAGALLLALPLVGASSVPLRARDGDTPSLPTDPNSTKYCSWWVDNEGSETCEGLLSVWGISITDFRRWNPSVTADCGGVVAGKSYCVEAMDEPAVPPPITTAKTTTTTSSSSTSSSKTTTSITSTTTAPSNGISTPLPTQPGMVTNCDAFYLVKSGDNCEKIATANGISVSQFTTWNTQIGGASCSGLWLDAYVCVSIIGHTPTTSKASTTTAPTNGIATPTPTQPGMVSNCDAFYLVKSGDNCEKIATANGISVSQFTTWNTQVGGASCSGLWLDVYVCVSIIGHTPTTSKSSTTTGNGIATPTPTQPGMVGNCDAFYKVKSGDNCEKIASANGISVSQFTTWNSQIGGAACNGLWVDVYVCVSIVGHTPTTPVKTTTTTAGNGIATPTPIQDGMTKSCKKFYFINQGDTCATIASKNKITVTQFVSWNPAVKSDCTGMWANTYACIGV